MLVLYPVTPEFIGSFPQSLGGAEDSLVCKIVSPANKDRFISSFQMWLPFLFLT